MASAESCATGRGPGAVAGPAICSVHNRSEIKAAFSESLRVRVLGPETKQLADRAFIETTVRLHRAGEGAAYTGLKPAGIDYEPAIPTAAAAIATGDLTQVKTLLVEEVEHELAARLDHVLETQTGAKETQTIAEVPAAP